jgi:CBS-domain-containing membrane protein
VITVTPETGFQELVAKMGEHRVSGVPVVDEDGRVVGIVSEADLLREGSHDRGRTRALDWFLHPGRTNDARSRGHTAGSIMTAPVVSVGPDVTIWDAIRKLRAAGVKRLPVVDEGGRLVGIVSRTDLLSAFVRSDEQIAAKVRSIVGKVFSTDVHDVGADVEEGRVILRGSVGFASQRDVLVELIDEIPGVLEIVDQLEIASHDERPRGVPFAPIQPPGEDLGPRPDL